MTGGKDVRTHFPAIQPDTDQQEHQAKAHQVHAEHAQDNGRIHGSGNLSALANCSSMAFMHLVRETHHSCC